MENLSYEKLLKEYRETFILSIPFILSSIQELNKNVGYIYDGSGLANYNFSFKKKCNNDEIRNFEKNIGHSLPEDYKLFLSYTNGLGLSEHAGSWLHDIDAMYDCRKYFTSYPTNLLVIGEFHDGDTHVMIDLKSDTDQCIYIHEVHFENPLLALNCSFTEFLNRFIITYGNAFWEWGVRESDKIPLIR